MANITVIHVGSFQPFESRRGKDTVVKLTFPYDPDLIRLLKSALRTYRDYAIDPSKNIFQPGGWRPNEKCWFVERSVWPMVRRDLLQVAGYMIEEDYEPSPS